MFLHSLAGCALDVLKLPTSSYLFLPPSSTKADHPAVYSYALGGEFKHRKYQILNLREV